MCLCQKNEAEISFVGQCRILTVFLQTKTPASAEPRGSTAKRQLLSDENATNSELKAEENSDPAVRIPLSPKRINQNGQVLKVDPRQPMKKRILAYNQMLMKENQEKVNSPPNQVTSQRSILPPVEISPRRKLDLENSPELLLSAGKKTTTTPPKKYNYLKEIDSPGEQKAGGLSRSPRLDKSPLLSQKMHDSDPADRWNGALALMQLASSPPSRKFSQQSN